MDGDQLTSDREDLPGRPWHPVAVSILEAPPLASPPPVPESRFSWAFTALISDFQALGLVRQEEKKGQSQLEVWCGRPGHVR